MRKRLTISVLVGLATGTFSCFLITRLHQTAGDFTWALHLAQRLVAHQNPYDTPLEQYPLPAAFPALPLLRLRPEIAAGVFYGVSSALLALGLTRKNYSRLRIFLAYPFWAGLLTAQWSTIITASAFFPTLLPATMMKPQVGRSSRLRFHSPTEPHRPAAVAATLARPNPLLRTLHSLDRFSRTSALARIVSLPRS